jgi:hypothetical protein
MTWIKAGVLLAMLGATVAVAAGEKKAWVPEKGFVPDGPTAIRIAEAVWIPIYGEKQLSTEKPFKAVLRNDTWIVTGTLPAGFRGGTAEAEISKRDGRILRVIHGQ